MDQHLSFQAGFSPNTENSQNDTCLDSHTANLEYVDLNIQMQIYSCIYRAYVYICIYIYIWVALPNGDPGFYSTQSQYSRLGDGLRRPSVTAALLPIAIWGRTLIVSNVSGLLGCPKPSSSCSFKCFWTLRVLQAFKLLQFQVFLDFWGAPDLQTLVVSSVSGL